MKTRIIKLGVLATVRLLLPLVASLSLAIPLTALGATAVKNKAANPPPDIESMAPAEVVRHLQDAFAAGSSREWDTLGLALAASAAKARGVLINLRKDDSIPATTLRAELLMWLARGNDVPKGPSDGEMPTEELGREAAALLDHPDPFVRGLAEWAIAIRLGKDYESAEERINGRRHPKPWPDKDGPDWYQRWLAIGPESLLDYEYVRQAVALGLHRPQADLLRAGEDLRRRAEGVVAHAEQHSTAQQLATVRAKHAELNDALAKLQAAMQSGTASLTDQRTLWLAARRAAREVALANPDIQFKEILFGMRQAARIGGNITNGRWNTHTPGGDIYVKTGLHPAAPARPLLSRRLGPGHVRGLDLSWDADKLVFAYAKQAPKTREPQLRARSEIGGYFGQGIGEVEEMSHLFEMGIDGSGLRQLTDAPDHADQEPAYLPNGDIVFVSDRSNFGSQCAGALDQDNMILNLYRCDPHGRNIRPLSNNKDFDRHPHIMDNGQVLFLHWEYQERHLWQTHALWTCRPDGTMTDAIYKQHIDSGPMSLREARQIRGQQKLVAIACGHHNYDQGAVFLADYSMGINVKEGMRNVTPGVSGTEGGYGGIKPVAEGGVQDRGGHYMFPYPLSEKSYLVAYSYKRPDNINGLNFGLYYIDVWGNKELIHRDKQLSVAFLMPVRAVPRPPVLLEREKPAKSTPPHAIAMVADVHADWPDATAGTIKYLRIAQKVPWPCVRDDSKTCGFNDLHWMPAAWEPVLGMWDWGCARVIGIVPVEDDGSAHFKVPAEQAVYFQALDENYLELRRMRSNVTFPAGETRSCVGCHESKAVAPPLPRGSMPLAMRRPPSTPEPPPWGDRVVPDYEKHIQPIFDRHCVRCHGETKPEGGLEYSSRRVDGYLQSYRTLFGLKPSDPTPFGKYYWSIWHPDKPALSDTATSFAKEFLRNTLRRPPPAQQVMLADYTGGAEVTQPLQFGSGKSRLTLVLLNDAKHKQEVKLNRDEWLSLVTWVDLNAQYWGTFVDKDPHYASKQYNRKDQIVSPRRVQVTFPDPWERPPAGDWVWLDANTVGLKP